MGGFFKALKKALVNFPKDFKTGIMKGLFEAIFGDGLSNKELKDSLGIFDKVNELWKKTDNKFFEAGYGVIRKVYGIITLNI